VINVEQWAEIRRLHFAEKMGIKTIARRLGVARNTVRSAAPSPGRYQSHSRSFRLYLHDARYRPNGA
jgi:hypothetical protein